jgi:hypothetical protein
MSDNSKHKDSIDQGFKKKHVYIALAVLVVMLIFGRISVLREKAKADAVTSRVTTLLSDLGRSDQNILRPDSVEDGVVTYNSPSNGGIVYVPKNQHVKLVWEAAFSKNGPYFQDWFWLTPSHPKLVQSESTNDSLVRISIVSRSGPAPRTFNVALKDKAARRSDAYIVLSFDSVDEPHLLTVNIDDIAFRVANWTGKWSFEWTTKDLGHVTLVFLLDSEPLP